MSLWNVGPAGLPPPPEPPAPGPEPPPQPATGATMSVAVIASKGWMRIEQDPFRAGREARDCSMRAFRAGMSGPSDRAGQVPQRDVGMSRTTAEEDLRMIRADERATSQPPDRAALAAGYRAVR